MKWLLMLPLLLSFYARGEVNIVERYKHYTVIANSKSKLLNAVNKASPIREGAEVFHGYTRFDINWRFWFKKADQQCQINRANTDLKLVYTLPKLQSGNHDVKIVWRNWLAKLTAHEIGHGDLAIATTRKINAALLNLDPQTNCEKLKKVANQTGQALMSELKQQTREYDEQTGHGKTQGAWLMQHL